MYLSSRPHDLGLELGWVHRETTRRESLGTKRAMYKGFLGHVKSTHCPQRC